MSNYKEGRRLYAAISEVDLTAEPWDNWSEEEHAAIDASARRYRDEVLEEVAQQIENSKKWPLDKYYADRLRKMKSPL